MNKDKSKLKNTSSKTVLNELNENNCSFNVTIKANHKYDFDKIKYFVCTYDTNKKYMKIDFFSRDQITRTIKLTPLSIESNKCQSHGELSVDNSLMISSIKIYDYLSGDEYCFEVCLRNELNHIECSLLGKKKSNDLIEINAEQGYDMIGFYGQYTVKQNGKLNIKMIGTTNKKIISKLNINSTGFSDRVNEKQSRSIDLIDSNKSNKSISNEISIDQIIYDSNSSLLVDNEIPFDLTLKNESSRFIYDSIRIYDCMDLHDVACSFAEFQSLNISLKNITNCPILLANITLVNELDLTNFDSISKINLYKNNDLVNAIELCFSDSNFTSECIYVYREQISHGSMIPIRAFSNSEIVGFKGTLLANKTKISISKFVILMEKKMTKQVEHFENSTLIESIRESAKEDLTTVAHLTVNYNLTVQETNDTDDYFIDLSPNVSTLVTQNAKLKKFTENEESSSPFQTELFEIVSEKF